MFGTAHDIPRDPRHRNGHNNRRCWKAWGWRKEVHRNRRRSLKRQLKGYRR